MGTGSSKSRICQLDGRYRKQSRSLYGRHVSTSFLDPVFGAMMKQACRQTLKSLAAECLVAFVEGC